MILYSYASALTLFLLLFLLTWQDCSVMITQIEVSVLIVKLHIYIVEPVGLSDCNTCELLKQIVEYY